jgi:hypothetical protein
MIWGLQKRELHWPSSLLLATIARERAWPPAADEIADLHFDDVTSTQLAVDC